jgi:hypothetical protein
MSTITIAERAKLEKFFGMRSVYVSNLSDATFGDFLAESVDIDIHDVKYQHGGGSKAKKFRQFWQLESDYIVGKAILALVQREEEILAESVANDPERKVLIEPCKSIANRLMSANVTLDDLKRAAAAFDARHLMDQIRRMESSVHQDPALAIGTAKELIETCCKTILSERGKPVKGTPDIPTLTRETLKELNLVPEGVSDSVRGSDTIKRILQNLSAIGHGLAELRGLYGTGHGKHGKAQSLKPRHAKLAVGAASTLVTFIFDTHIENSHSRESA